MQERLYTPKPQTHLDSRIPNASPIMACLLGQPNLIDRPERSFEQEMTHEVIVILQKIKDAKKNKTATYVDYEGFPEVLKEEGFLNDGFQTYTISPVDDKDKFSTELYDCTGLIVTGIDRETGQNISFTTHQDPKIFFSDSYNQSRFREDLRKRLDEVKSRCLPGTIDAVIVGGLHKEGEQEGTKNDRIYRTNYLNSIKLLSEETEQLLNFEPIIINGPKNRGPDDYFYDNKNRRLYLVRPEVNSSTPDFPPSDIDELKGSFHTKST